MTRQTKFVKGARIETTAEKVAAIEAGRYLYIRDRPVHPSVLISMTVLTIGRLTLHYAELREEGP